GPAAVVEGALLAVADPRTRVILVGDEAKIRAELDRLRAPSGIRTVHAPTVVGMDESASSVVRRRRDSSIWRATELVKSGEADAVVSAGHTGASMATAFFLLGTLQGVERPAIATILPTLRGKAVLLDVGANVDSKPQHLVQFAIMGHVYAQRMLDVASPRVGLLSIGEEDTKGNELTKETFKLLKQTQVNFIGNVEGRDVYTGTADVVVCDGFIGNVALKLSEGLAETIMQVLRREITDSVAGRLGFLLLRPAFRRFKRRVDYAEYGGAPLLGINGVSIICHGRSSPKAIKNAVLVARDFVAGRVNRHIRDDIERHLHQGSGTPG
ncbi:MAG TPA: phosphate acyltransferase PlsX, partial [Nitrospiria bacterium]|nr:phosphate acyltransferase PlsX [Nitrospiria bacterium]